MTKEELSRLNFWLKYLEADKAKKTVKNNPPDFDEAFQEMFPDPSDFKALIGKD